MKKTISFAGTQAFKKLKFIYTFQSYFEIIKDHMDLNIFSSRIAFKAGSSNLILFF